jgi:hypothetical protein
MAKRFPAAFLLAPVTFSLASCTSDAGSPRSVVCQNAWDGEASYVGGQLVSVDKHNFVATEASTGDDPRSTSDDPGTGAPWIDVGACKTVEEVRQEEERRGGLEETPTGSIEGLVFTAYKDITVNANWNTNVISQKLNGELLPVADSIPELGAVSWSFATGECGSETWGGMAADAVATANVAAWAAAGKKYILSTGGAAGRFSCKSDEGFAQFLDRYMSSSLVGVDFDVEAGQTPETLAELVARAKAAQQNPKYDHLLFSFTVATFGGNREDNLGDMGRNVMAAVKSAGLTKYMINLMTMDYGRTLPENCMIGGDGLCDMGASAVAAAKSLHNHDGVPYSQIAITPMIGGNDTQDETFTLHDVETLSAFAKEVDLGGIHIWSLDRDTDCAPGYASPICNSYGQSGALGFLHAFQSALR